MNVTRHRSWLAATNNPRTCDIHDLCTACLTNVAVDKRAKDWRGLRPALLFDSLATELGR